MGKDERSSPDSSEANYGTAELLFVDGVVGSLYLLNEQIDFIGGQFAGVAGHASFAIGDEVAQMIGRGSSNLVGNKRGSAEMSAFGSFPMAAGAIFFVHGIVSEA